MERESRAVQTDLPTSPRSQAPAAAALARADVVDPPSPPRFSPGDEVLAFRPGKLCRRVLLEQQVEAERHFEQFLAAGCRRWGRRCRVRACRGGRLRDSKMPS